MKKLIKYIFTTLGYAVVFANPVGAFSDMVYIQDLPEYLNYQTITLHYTAASESPVTAKFFYKKDGGSYTEFASASGYAGEAQVTGSMMDEQQKKYYFKVEINGGSAMDETSVTYDASGPDAVSDYAKEKVENGHYKLKWRNPQNTDFLKVFIYRSDSIHFTADGGTKVAEAGGAPNSEQTWDNSGLDTSKEYYYAIRAMDKAGNPSPIVADSETTVQVLGVAADADTAEGSVASLPKEEGSVLSDSDDKTEGKDSDSDAPTKTSFSDSIKSLGWSKLLIIALVASGIGFLLYSYLKKEKK